MIALLSALLLVLGRGRSDAPNNSAEVAQIQDCQLYLLRNDSVKGARECMFVVLLRPHRLPVDTLSSSYNTAVATIRKSDTEFAYQLVITRAFAEGEAELLDEEDECLSIRFATSPPALTDPVCRSRRRTQLSPR